MKKKAERGAVLLITTVALSFCSFICSILVGFVINSYRVGEKNIEIQKEKIYVMGNIHRVVDAIFNSTGNLGSSISCSLLDINGNSHSESVNLKINGVSTFYVSIDPDFYANDTYLKTAHYTANFKINTTSNSKENIPISSLTTVSYLLNSY